MPTNAYVLLAEDPCWWTPAWPSTGAEFLDALPLYDNPMSTGFVDGSTGAFPSRLTLSGRSSPSGSGRL